jgi:dTDP-glucose 4,6-dehydratase
MYRARIPSAVARLLVTGGAGFIGSNFVRMAVRKGHDVSVLDKLTYAGNLENLRDLLDGGRIEFARGDVCDPAAVGAAVRGCDAVVHAAAETHVDRSVMEAGDFVRTDVLGTHVVLEAARREGVERVIHISTDEIFGESGGRPSREDSPLNPKSPYAASKAGADRLAYAYHHTYGLPVVITRCVNNYGPYQHPEKAIPMFAVCGIAGVQIPVYGSGRNRREWIHVDDHGSALLTLLRKRGIEGETFNIGTGERRTTLQVAAAVLDALGEPRGRIGRVADRPGHVESHAVDSAKLRRMTGWRPAHAFDRDVPKTVRWYADHREWWRPTMLKGARAYFEERYPGLIEAVEKLGD